MAMIGLSEGVRGKGVKRNGGTFCNFRRMKRVGDRRCTPPLRDRMTLTRVVRCKSFLLKLLLTVKAILSALWQEFPAFSYNRASGVSNR
jgi:hypothetical protein